MQAGNVGLHFDKNPIAHARVDHNRRDIDNLHVSGTPASKLGRPLTSTIDRFMIP
jgi:hypothetical protein